jgi:hypothetical protein
MSDNKTFNQYFSTRPKLSITMPQGGRIYFVAGHYATDNEDEITFLDEQIRAKHPMIYVKATEKTVTSEQLDPMAAIRKKIIEEHEAKKAEQADPNRNMGSSIQDVSASITTTKTIAPIIAGSKSGSK